MMFWVDRAHVLDNGVHDRLVPVDIFIWVMNVVSLGHSHPLR